MPRDEELEKLGRKVWGNAPLTPAERPFARPAAQPAEPSRGDRLQNILTSLENKAQQLEERSRQLFTTELQQKLTNTLIATPQFRQLQEARRRESGELQTRFRSELGEMEPSATVDPLAQLDAANTSRKAVTENLSDIKTAIEGGKGFAKDVVSTLLEGEAQKSETLQDQFSTQRELLADTLSVQREQRQAAESARGGKAGTEEVGGTEDEVELINLALDNMTEEQRKQIELLPTASRKNILIQRGREVRREQEAARSQAMTKLYGTEQMSLSARGEAAVQAELAPKKEAQSQDVSDLLLDIGGLDDLQ